MSMNEDQDLENHDEHDDPPDADDAPADEAKKPNKNVMIAAVAGAVLVLGFAGAQIYKKVSKPSAAGLDQSMMVEAPPAASPAQALVPAGAQPEPVSPSGSEQAGAGAPEIRMLSTSELGGAAPNPMGGPNGPSVSMGSSAQPAASGGAAPQANSPTSLGAGSGPVDMTALQSLKSQQEVQAKRIDTFDNRLDKLESRISQISSGERVVRTESAPKRSWQPKKTAVNKSMAKAASKRRKAALRDAGESGSKDGSEYTVKLPPAPVDISKAEMKSDPDRVVGRINGLRIQAVIPGRAWVQDDAGVTRSFAMGDAIRPGVVIKSIDADKGVIETSVGAIR